MKKVSTAAAERLLALAGAAATSRWLCQGQTSPPPRLAEQGIRFGLNYVPRKPGGMPGWIGTRHPFREPSRPLRLEAQQRQGTVTFASQAKQCVHHGGRNYRNWWFAAS